LVQGLYKLTRDAVTMQEVGTSYINITQPEALLAVERRATLTFDNANEVVDRVAQQLQNPEGQGYVRRFKSGLADLQKKLLGPTGLFAAHREYLAVSDEMATMQTSLAASETRYVSSLEEVRQLVEQHNDRAKDIAAQTVHSALGFIGFLVLVGLGTGAI